MNKSEMMLELIKVMLTNKHLVEVGNFGLSNNTIDNIVNDAESIVDKILEKNNNSEK